MNESRHITLFHAPNTRGTGALTLLEELGADYDLHILDLKTKEQHGEDYLQINPMGKVPAIRHGDAVVTEQVAVYLYLADLYPEARLAPMIGDVRRGPYLRWMVFYSACFEPAVIDRALKREPAPRAMSPYGDYDTMFNALTDQLGRGDYMLGNTFMAVDVLWGTALKWMLAFKLVADLPVITAYANRVAARPAAARVIAREAVITANPTA